ncbi:MATE family efflux transporter [Bacillus sp. ISL-40]|uniref:MATE family efflux transporter n=1 Tax=unclassified Bacillus (in: firmicutes) TaxID=185979 RepID=UPI001BEA46CE|nr:MULTISPECIES: MATE family efflux transporter [unclassified Bacillus (in: firmicutes)]MBT2697570.1 MATE family efflux transporter [Bacillus sp. ISL-40]MBT2720879.1 MATE family efflux transporter [Bacillus sp. ISL-46]MBT2742275.1 MATE family efflux transporter [Bacillus sp. ISL-77]
MTLENNKYQDQSLFSITWPLFIEITLHMSMGIVATLILSGYSDNAVAGVGVANQILNIFILVFNITAIGATILIGQNLGANRLDRARRLARSSFGVNFWFGVVMTIIVVAFGGLFLKFYGLSGEVYDFAYTFLTIIGLSLFLEAISLALSAVLRSYGHTKETMVVTVIMNVISMIGSFIAIKGWFGLPVTGVAGVAYSIFVARIFIIVALFYFVYKQLALKFHIKDIFKINKTDVKELLSIGIPSAGENLSYQFSQVVITSFVALTGDAALAARVYILNISMICFLFTVAIAQGTQLLIARYIGAKQYDRALKRGLKTLKIAVIVSAAVSLAVALIGKPILTIFTTDTSIIAIALPVLWAIVFIEPGRAMNIVLMGSLKSVGDVRFPVVIGVICMWGIAVVFSYFFGITLGLGLLGVWLAQGLDECIRGFFALNRWVSKPWLKKKIAEQKVSPSVS